MKSQKICLSILLSLVLSAYAYGSPSNVAINLGTADNFGVLGGSGVTNASSGTFITGDVGSAPTPAVTGLLPSQVNGTLYLTPNAATTQAQSDLTVGYNDAAGAACGTNLTGTDLGGLTLLPGVYCFSSSAALTGTLTLDAQGNANAQWVFQIGTTLTTATNSTVSLINGATQCNVFWQIGSSATIQTNNAFVGIIMALTSITLDGGTLNGKALARNGSVTISAQETINGPACTCHVFVTSSTAGTLTNISFPRSPFNPANSTQAVIATGLTSAEGLTCGTDRRLYLAQSGVLGGPRRIVRLDQSGRNMKVICDFQTLSGLTSSGGPAGPSFGPPGSPTQSLFFNTTFSSGFSNTGAWSWTTKPPSSLAQTILPFPPNGTSNGGGATAFLILGTFAGDLLAVDEANNKVVRVTPPFTWAQPPVDFITANLTGPVGLAVNTAGDVFVSSTDGTIKEFASDGTFLSQFATTGFHNMNIFEKNGDLIVATQEGPVIWIKADGTQTTFGSVAGGDGLAICQH